MVRYPILGGLKWIALYWIISVCSEMRSFVLNQGALEILPQAYI